MQLPKKVKFPFPSKIIQFKDLDSFSTKKSLKKIVFENELWRWIIKSIQDLKEAQMYISFNFFPHFQIKISGNIN